MLILAFVFAAVAMRFLPHAWNFTPVIAMLLLAGAFMKPKHLWIPVAALIASDFALNLFVYHTSGGLDQYFTWAAYLLVLGLALLALKNKVRLTALIGTSLASSTVFFAISNLGVWLAGGLYPRTLAGLGTCYWMAIPFYRNAAIGDLLYVGVFFGLYSLIAQRLPRASAVSI